MDEYGYSTDGKMFYGRHATRDDALDAGAKAHPRSPTLYSGLRVKDGERIGQIIVDPSSVQFEDMNEPQVPMPETAVNTTDDTPAPKKKRKKKTDAD